MRFERDEQQLLRPIAGKAPFLQVRELSRRVHSDACVELDTNRYSVPWRLIGESVTVVVSDHEVRVFYAGELVARHTQSLARRTSTIDRSHLAGIVGAPGQRGVVLPLPVAHPAELLRPLSEYESATGGTW